MSDYDERETGAGGLDGVEPGKRLVRADERGPSLGSRIAQGFYKLTWRTPLHNLRLNGRYPLKLLAVPVDPLAGDPQIGRAMLSGTLYHRGVSVPIAGIDAEGVPPAMEEHLQRFAWLRDLAAAGTRQQGAGVGEKLMRRWLDRHGNHVTDAAWSPERIGWRILFWSAHAPLILSANDQIYRSAVLNALARGARHLERGVERAPAGLPRITGWVGIVAAGLLIPGGESRRAVAEASLVRALTAGVGDDGGINTRAPADQMALVELLAMLERVYEARRATLPAEVAAVRDRAVAALLGLTLGDGALSSWQGTGPIAADQVAALVTASRVRTRPLRQSRDWGYQRMAASTTTVVIDAGPPPPVRRTPTGGLGGGCASTLAFELSDGDRRVIINCGGPGDAGTIPADLVQALRSTAAHSTLVLADSNSTAIQPDGSLGAGVASVEVDRDEREGGSRVEARHDGYLRRFGMIHKRTLALSASGRELQGEDALLFEGKRRRGSAATKFAIRFHLAPGVEVTPTADKLAALLRVTGEDGGPASLWQFRCRGGTLAVEDSLWIDADGRPVPTQQFVVEGEAAAGGTSVTWLLKRAG